MRLREVFYFKCLNKFITPAIGKLWCCSCHKLTALLMTNILFIPYFCNGKYTNTQQRPLLEVFEIENVISRIRSKKKNRLKVNVLINFFLELSKECQLKVNIYLFARFLFCFLAMIDSRPNAWGAAWRDTEIARESERERKTWDWREEEKKKRSWPLSQSRPQSPQVKKRQTKKQDTTVFGEKRKNKTLRLRPLRHPIPRPLPPSNND